MVPLLTGAASGLIKAVPATSSTAFGPSHKDLLGLVKAALEKMEAREVTRVRIRPEDAAMVKQFLEKMGLPQQLEVVADASLERGAAILDSSRGALDASVGTQLAEIERGLADLVKRS